MEYLYALRKFKNKKQPQLIERLPYIKTMKKETSVDKSHYSFALQKIVLSNLETHDNLTTLFSADNGDKALRHHR